MVPVQEFVVNAFGVVFVPPGFAEAKRVYFFLFKTDMSRYLDNFKNLKARKPN
jgi:hypothetical protein